jgi:hypothetical protein
MLHGRSTVVVLTVLLAAATVPVLVHGQGSTGAITEDLIAKRVATYGFRIPEFKEQDAALAGDAVIGEARYDQENIVSRVILSHRELGMTGTDAEIASDILGYRAGCSAREPTEEEVELANREIAPFLPDRSGGDDDVRGADGRLNNSIP